MATNPAGPDGSTRDAQFARTLGSTQAQPESLPQPYGYPEKKIFGLRVATFLLSLALLLVIIAGIFGGVVGSRAYRCVGRYLSLIRYFLS